MIGHVFASKRLLYISCSTLIMAQVAFFAAIPKSDLAKSEVIVAGVFFRNVFGNSAATKCLPVFIALSDIGNVLAVSFSQARVNQGTQGLFPTKNVAYLCDHPELAKEGLLPWSSFWASDKPFNTPMASVSLRT